MVIRSTHGEGGPSVGVGVIVGVEVAVGTEDVGVGVGVGGWQMIRPSFITTGAMGFPFASARTTPSRSSALLPTFRHSKTTWARVTVGPGTPLHGVALQSKL
jgi:hypothetical protein